MHAPRLLLVDDDLEFPRLVKGFLERRDYRVEIENEPEHARRRFHEGWDLVLLDIHMPGGSGVDLLEALMSVDPTTPCVMLTGDDDVETALHCIRLGAYDYLTKPVDRDRLLGVVEEVVGEASSSFDPFKGLKQPQAFEGIVTGSPKLGSIFRYLERVAPANECLIISGPSGAGKERLARAIHALSDRRGEVFLGVNLAAIPAGLFASHLFGHSAGAFSGATGSRKGYFEETEAGTLFLDEIGSLDWERQAQLLRVIQEREYFVLGETKPTPLRSRLVVATNTALEEEVEAGRFRADLFYRLRAGAVSLPPLRERPEDIPLLGEHFVRRFSEAYGRKVKGMTQRTLELLVSWSWPGNVRELENIIREAVLLEDGPLLRPASLPDEYRKRKTTACRGSFQTLEEVTREHTLRVVEAYSGNVTQAAKILGISRVTLSRRLKAYRTRKRPGSK